MEMPPVARSCDAHASWSSLRSGGARSARITSRKRSCRKASSSSVFQPAIPAETADSTAPTRPMADVPPTEASCSMLDGRPQTASSRRRSRAPDSSRARWARTLAWTEVGTSWPSPRTATEPSITPSRPWRSRSSSSTPAWKGLPPVTASSSRSRGPGGAPSRARTSCSRPSGPSPTTSMVPTSGRAASASRVSRTGSARRARTRDNGRSRAAFVSRPSRASESASAWWTSSAQSATGPSAHRFSTASITRSGVSASGG